MAAQDQEELRDDLDVSEPHHTVEFSFRARAYEIDRSADNAEAFYNAIERYIGAARPVEYQDPPRASALSHSCRDPSVGE